MAWWWTFGSVPEVPAQEVFDNCVSGTDESIIIDVRTRNEYDGGHIEGAKWCSLIPPWSFESRVTETLNAIDPLWRENKRRILFICLSAHRSISGVKLLTQLGRTNVMQLQGGMQAWRAANLPEVVEHPKQVDNNNNDPVGDGNSGKTSAPALSTTAEQLPVPADSHEQ